MVSKTELFWGGQFSTWWNRDAKCYSVTDLASKSSQNDTYSVYYWVCTSISHGNMQRHGRANTIEPKSASLLRKH